MQPKTIFKKNGCGTARGNLVFRLFFKSFLQVQYSILVQTFLWRSIIGYTAAQLIENYNKRLHFAYIRFNWGNVCFFGFVNLIFGFWGKIVDFDKICSCIVDCRFGSGLYVVEYARNCCKLNRTLWPSFCRIYKSWNKKL